MTPMLDLKERIDLVHHLAGIMHPDHPRLREVILEAGRHNPWFIPEEVHRAIGSIREAFLDQNDLAAWAARYQVPPHRDTVRTVGLVMAGNIPLVGFHDWLSVFISGHRALIRLSDKDSRLLPFLLDELVALRPEAAAHWQCVGKLQGMDAVIATGSNNSARYFEAYFGAWPHIIRKNRNAVAVLHGDESDEELAALMADIFPYFGLGCRNVAALRVPQAFELPRLLDAASAWDRYQDVDRYRNNYDYQCALLLLNRTPFLQGSCLLLKEDPSFLSPISTLHYQRYGDLDALTEELVARREEIQCIVSARALPGLEVIPPGTSQRPGLTDYADGVDTMAFLQTL